jgi:stage II sporulation protein D
MVRLIICLFCFLGLTLNSQEFIRVGLFRASKISSIAIFPKGNSTTINIGENIHFTGKSDSIPFYVSANGNLIDVFYESVKLGSVKQVSFESNPEDYLFFKPSRPDFKGNNYKGKLLITSKEGILNTINELPVNTYLNGVIRGEIGFDKDPVVYEVHAIMSRTYAYRFYNKHKYEGFNVCDQTHCQVYKGFFNYEQFTNSIGITNNKVMYDSVDHTLAEGLFHANCGGITNSSENVWSGKLNYCRSIEDTFCINGKHAHWEFKCSREEFFDKINLDLKNISCEDICYYSDARSIRIPLGTTEFNTITLRNVFKLKSSFFNLECNPETDSILVSGRGFGHGVGLCQEGAIRMAELCYSANEILQFYYNGVLIEEYFIQ